MRAFTGGRVMPQRVPASASRLSRPTRPLPVRLQRTTGIRRAASLTASFQGMLICPLPAPAITSPLARPASRGTTHGSASA